MTKFKLIISIILIFSIISLEYSLCSGGITCQNLFSLNSSFDDFNINSSPFQLESLQLQQLLPNPPPKKPPIV